MIAHSKFFLLAVGANAVKVCPFGVDAKAGLALQHGKIEIQIGTRKIADRSTMAAGQMDMRFQVPIETIASTGVMNYADAPFFLKNVKIAIYSAQADIGEFFARLHQNRFSGRVLFAISNDVEYGFSSRAAISFFNFHDRILN